MGSIFDIGVKALLGTLDGVLCYDAEWQRGADDVLPARVFYRDETGTQRLEDLKFNTDLWKAEYRNTDFPGLKAIVNRNGKPVIRIRVADDWLTFNAIKADAVTDGTLVRLTLRLQPTA
jgi:hypothetical protein